MISKSRNKPDTHQTVADLGVPAVPGARLAGEGPNGPPVINVGRTDITHVNWRTNVIDPIRDSHRSRTGPGTPRTRHPDPNRTDLVTRGHPEQVITVWATGQGELLKVGTGTKCGETVKGEIGRGVGRLALALELT